MYHLLQAAGILAYLSTQGHTQPTPGVHTSESSGAWEAISQEEIRSDFVTYLYFLPPQFGIVYTVACDFTNEDWPPEIWGWRCRNPKKRYNISFWAEFNGTSITELCYRRAQGLIYEKYGIYDYNKVTMVDAYRRIGDYERLRDEAVRINGDLSLKPHPTNPDLRLDKFGEEWYYVSKEWVFHNILIPKRSLLVEYRRKDLRPGG